MARRALCGHCCGHRRPASGASDMGPAAAALTLWLAARAAAATLPTTAFLVRSAGWDFTEGAVPADELLDATTGQTECE